MSARSTRFDRWLAVALGVGYFAILLITSREVGFVRDEGYYFRAASEYSRWFDALWDHPGTAFSNEVITRAYAFNAEHPALLKNTFALSWKLLHAKLGWTSGSTACRVPAMLLAGLLVALTYLFGAQAYRRRVGLFAALAVATMPRLFHDAHLACFDVGITALELLVVYCYWRSLDSHRWGVATGATLGLALATKHNAVFIPLILAAHTIARGGLFVGGGGRGMRRLPPVPLAFVAMAVLAPLVFFLHWPWLWHETAERLGFYLRFHLHHVHYPVEYFGQVLEEPPFPRSFAFVMTWLTVPLPVVALMTSGFVRSVARELRSAISSFSDEESSDPRRTRLLLLLAGFYPLFVISMPGVPIFGGVKHWFTAMPALALLGAVELDRLLGWALARARLVGRRAAVAFAAAAALVLLPGVLGIQLIHPYGIGFYNELAGGIRGAADLGMLRNFWGYTGRGSFAYLNRHAADGETVFFHHINPDAWAVARDEGLVRSDLRFGMSLDSATWAFHEIQRAMVDDEYKIWNDWGTTRPVTGVYVDEVPMNLLYRRDLK